MSEHASAGEVSAGDPAPGDRLRGADAAPPAAPADDRALTPAKIDQTLRVSIRDGCAWSVMHGLGERYLGPFVVLNTQGPLPVAAVSVVPALFGSLVQLVAADVTDALKRRKLMFVAASTAQALMWLPICVALFLPIDASYWVIFAAYGLMLVFHNFGVPAWASVMGDVVPPERRGRYFGVRNALIGTGIILSGLLAGEWITYAENRPEFELLGLQSRRFAFLALFLTACAARLVSVHYLTRMHEPPYDAPRSEYFTLLEFIRRAPRAHFGRFVLYYALINMGIWFVNPFYQWYVLSLQHWEPKVWAWIATANLVAYFGSQPFWGRMIDRFGSKRILVFGGFGTIVGPLLLLCSGNIAWFTGVYFFEGTMTAATAISANAYLLDTVTPPKRARCMAYYMLFLTIGVALGGLAGGATAEYLPGLIESSFGWAVAPFTLLLIGAAVLRAIPCLLLSHTFQEFRVNPPDDLWRNMGVTEEGRPAT